MRILRHAPDDHTVTSTVTHQTGLSNTAYQYVGEVLPADVGNA